MAETSAAGASKKPFYFEKTDAGFQVLHKPTIGQRILAYFGKGVYKSTRQGHVAKMLAHMWREANPEPQPSSTKNSEHRDVHKAESGSTTSSEAKVNAVVEKYGQLRKIVEEQLGTETAVTAFWANIQGEAVRHKEVLYSDGPLPHFVDKSETSVGKLAEQYISTLLRKMDDKEESAENKLRCLETIITHYGPQSFKKMLQDNSRLNTTVQNFEEEVKFVFEKSLNEIKSEKSVAEALEKLKNLRENSPKLIAHLNSDSRSNLCSFLVGLKLSPDKRTIADQKTIDEVSTEIAKWTSIDQKLINAEHVAAKAMIKEMFESIVNNQKLQKMSEREYGCRVFRDSSSRAFRDS